MSLIFEEAELRSISDPLQLNQAAGVVKQRFDQRRATYHQYRTMLITLPAWSKFSQLLEDFELKSYRKWHSQWAALQQGPKPDGMVAYFNQGNTIFQPLEEFIAVNPIIISNDAPILREGIEKNIQEIEAKFSVLRQQINDEIKSGIDNLLALKGELALAKDFSDNIITEHSASVTSAKRFFKGFSTSIFLYIGLMVSLFFIKPVEDLNLFGQIGIRLSITLPFAFFAYFLFSQYKFYKAASLKFGQLKNFLGGGITHLNQLLNASQDNRAEINKKISEKFISMDDLIEMLANTKAPIPDMDVSKSLKEIRDTIKELKETVKIVDPK